MAAPFRTYLDLTNTIIRELNEVELTTVNFASGATGIQKLIKDQINRAYFDICNAEDKWSFLAVGDPSNEYYGNKMRSCIVRYGNVMNSRGSVLPIFISHAKKNDPFLIKIPSKFQSSKLKIKLIIYTDEVEINSFKIKSGSILYMEEATLLLEGDLANFAVRRKDLSNYGCGDALWFVEFQADNLSETFTTSTTLYLNNKKPEFIKQLQSDQFLIHLIKSDVITTVLSSILLGEDDFQLDFSSEYPDDSLGKIVCDWLSSLNVKKESDLKNIRYQAVNDQGLFRSRCQNLANSSEEG